MKANDIDFLARLIHVVLTSGACASKPLVSRFAVSQAKGTCVPRQNSQGQTHGSIGRFIVVVGFSVWVTARVPL